MKVFTIISPILKYRKEYKITRAKDFSYERELWCISESETVSFLSRVLKNLNIEYKENLVGIVTLE